MRMGELDVGDLAVHDHDGATDGARPTWRRRWPRRPRGVGGDAARAAPKPCGVWTATRPVAVDRRHRRRCGASRSPARPARHRRRPPGRPRRPGRTARPTLRAGRRRGRGRSAARSGTAARPLRTEPARVAPPATTRSAPARPGDRRRAAGTTTTTPSATDRARRRPTSRAPAGRRAPRTAWGPRIGFRRPPATTIAHTAPWAGSESSAHRASVDICHICASAVA